MDKVLIGVVGYNSIELLDKCLCSAVEQTWKNIEIMYFDNASTDGSVALVKEKFTAITCIQNPDNIGFGPAHNKIILSNEYDFYIPLNPDVILDNDFVNKAIQCFHSAAQPLGAVNGLVCYLKNGVKSGQIYSCGHLMFRDRRIHDMYRGDLVSDIEIKNRYIFGPNGACPVLSQKMISSLLINGYFYEPVFFFTGDDIDVSWRMARKGWKCLFSPELRAWHAAGSTKKYWSLKIRVEYIANRYLVILRNDHLLLFLKDSFIIIPVDILYFLLNILKRPSFILVILMSIMKVSKYFFYILKSRRQTMSRLALIELNSLFEGDYFHRIIYLFKNHFYHYRKIHIPG
jgi:GT2 family glycosyltransferase